MTVPTSVVKLTAKDALKNNWLKAIIVACIFIAVDFFVKFAGSILFELFGIAPYLCMYGIGLLFLIYPLFLGVFRFFWRVLMGANDNPLIIFHYFLSFGLYKKSLKLILGLLFKIIAIGLPILIPSIVIAVISNPDFYDTLGIAIPLWSENLNSIAYLIFTISVVLLLFISARFYLAPMLFVADENMEADEAIHMSKVISKKTQTDFIYLTFSFLLWIIASLFYVPMLYTLPYIITSYLVHCRFAVADYNLFIKEKNQMNLDFFSANI